MQQTIRIATRGSALARTQATWVAACLTRHHPNLKVETRIVKTLADAHQEIPLHGFRQRGVFVKEIENALLSGEANLAVHSMKDLPADLPDGLVVGAVPPREDPLDVLVLRDAPAPPKAGIPLPEGALVGSSSLRRQAQLRHHRPDLRFCDLRGNVDTRLRKLETGAMDAIILAAAGLIRLGLAERISARLPEEISLPAVCQGALAIECRADDAPTLALLQALDDPETRSCVTAERALLRALGGGCAVPVGGLARIEGAALVLQGAIAHPDGSRLVRETQTGSPDDPEGLGAALGARLLAAGGQEILQEMRSQRGVQDA
jgi:hydroxymethylbilane synthase